MISDCPVYIETQSGHLEDVRRIEVQESAIIGDPNPARLVSKWHTWHRGVFGL